MVRNRILTVVVDIRPGQMGSEAPPLPGQRQATPRRAKARLAAGQALPATEVTRVGWY